MKPHHQPVAQAVGEDGHAGHPASLMLVRVFSDGIEINEQYGESRTADLIRELRRLGVLGEVDFRTPCG